MPPHIAHDALEMIEYEDLPVVLILADDAVGAERARRSAERAGCRVGGTAGLAEAVERLDRQAALDAVLVEVAHDPGPALDRLLDRLEWAARTERHGSVVSVPAALIDTLIARAPHAAVHPLCEASELERVTAVAAAALRRRPRLHDVRRDQGMGLQQLSEEVGRIASILASLSEEAGAVEPVRPTGRGRAEPEINVGQIRAIIRARRLRDQYFPAQLFADPAWDMLLDLLAARLTDKRVAVSSLCIAAAVPPTTALRWIKTLCEHGLFVRSADPHDGRRVYIELSDAAAEALVAYLGAAQRLSPLLI